MAVAQLINPLIHGFDDDDSRVDSEHNIDSDDKSSLKEKLSETVRLKRVKSGDDERPGSPTPSTTPSVALSSSTDTSSTIVAPVFNALRLIKLSDRVSAVMKSHDTSTLLHSDPLLSIYRMFALFQGINVLGEVDVVPEAEMAGSTLERATGFGAEMIIVPWVIHTSSSNSAAAANVLSPANDGWQSQAQTPRGNVGHNPFDALFKAAPTSLDTHTHTHTHPSSTTHAQGQQGYWSLATGTSLIHSHFIRNVFARSDVDVGLYVDQSGIVSATSHHDPTSSAADPLSLVFGVGNGSNKGRGRVHIFLPFVGGPDDRLALEFVVGLCRKNERLRATVVRLKKVEGNAKAPGVVGVDGTIPGAEGADKDQEKDIATEVRNEEVNTTTIASVSYFLSLTMTVFNSMFVCLFDLCRVHRDSRIRFMDRRIRSSDFNPTLRIISFGRDM
jgi:hypothetical protein